MTLSLGVCGRPGRRPSYVSIHPESNPKVCPADGWLCVLARLEALLGALLFIGGFGSKDVQSSLGDGVIS